MKDVMHMSKGIVQEKDVTLLTVPQAARETGTTESYIRALIAKGMLRTVNPYGTTRGTRIWRGDLERTVTGGDGA